MLQKELLKTKPDPGHLLPSVTRYLEMQTSIHPILPFRALSEHTVYLRFLKSRLICRTGLRYNHTYMAQWGQIWRRTKRGNKHNLG